MWCKRTRVCSRDELPLDVVEDILVRLPVKHVLRCKLLSKTYHAWINTPAFIKKHRLFHRSSTADNIIFALRSRYEEKNPRIGKVVSLLNSPSQVYVLPPFKEEETLSQQPSQGHVQFRGRSDILAGSSNGLLCLLSEGICKRTYLLWNPATGEHKILPNPLIKHCSALGFGYDATSDDYKLVKISSCNSCSTVEFWSMKRNSWRQVSEIGSVPHDIGGVHGSIETGVMVSGELYWLTTKNIVRGYRNIGRDMFLSSFDMVSNGFCSKITLPDALTSQISNCSTKIFEFRGSLGLLVYHYSRTYSYVISKYDVWVMDEDHNHGNLWTKLCSVKPSEAGGGCPTRVSFNGKLLLSAWNCEHNNTKFLLYDPHTKEREELEAKLSTPDFCFLPPWKFTESLVSLN